MSDSIEEVVDQYVGITLDLLECCDKVIEVDGKKQIVFINNENNELNFDDEWLLMLIKNWKRLKIVGDCYCNDSNNESISIIKLVNKLPDDMVYLNITLRVDYLDLIKLPANLQTLYICINNGVDTDDTSKNSLNYEQITNLISNLPIGLKQLQIKCRDLHCNLDILPVSIEVLILEYNYINIDNFDNLPSNLKVLILRNSYDYPPVDENVTEYELTLGLIFNAPLNNLPKTLTHLYLNINLNFVKDYEYVKSYLPNVKIVYFEEYIEKKYIEMINL